MGMPPLQCLLLQPRRHHVVFGRERPLPRVSVSRDKTSLNVCPTKWVFVTKKTVFVRTCTLSICFFWCFFLFFLEGLE